MHFTPSWRTVLLGLAVVLAILAYPLVQTGRAASEPCAALDRAMDWSGCLRTIDLPDDTYLLGVAAAPDGRHLAISQKVGLGLDSITAIELITLDGTPVWTVTEPGWFDHLAFSPDGSRLAGSGGGDTPIVWDAASGAKLQQLTKASSLIAFLSFSADSSHLLAGNELWRIADGALIDTIEPQDAAAKGVRLPGWSFCEREVWSADGTLRSEITDAEKVPSSDGTHDNTMLVTMRITRIADGREVVLEQMPVDLRSTCSFSPDSKLILMNFSTFDESSSTHLVIWSTEDGKVVRHIILPYSSLIDAVWSADSSAVIIPDEWERRLHVFRATK